MNQPRNIQPDRKAGAMASPSCQRWESTDDAVVVQLITSVAVGAMLLVPAFLLLDQLSPSLGSPLTTPARPLDRIALD